MTTRLLVGDVFKRMAELDDGSFDLIVTSPPFLALRSYLPDGHPQKDLEIGSEANPAAYLDVLLALTAEWRRLLAPHGSIAVELGDTYSGSGGAGGDYNPGGLREVQPFFDGSGLASRGGRRCRPADVAAGIAAPTQRPGPEGRDKIPGWPLDKSLTGIPTLYAWSLAYGRNLLTGAESPAGRWRVRNLKPWIRSNPPVGALGDKERPATSYITVACTGRDRWFDLDAVRTQATTRPQRRFSEVPRTVAGQPASPSGGLRDEPGLDGSGGAPPLDWWHHVDAIIDAEIDQRARDVGATVHENRSSESKRAHKTDGGWATPGDATWQRSGARGVHIRRALEKAGILTTLDAYDVSPKGYAGAHYAVWPPELVRLMISEMCPRRVCTTCGVPSRRIVGEASYTRTDSERVPARLAMTDGERLAEGVNQHHQSNGANTSVVRNAPTLGWSDCGCRGGHWRPGRVLDPFVGSGTTLAVASGMGRDSVGIDLDERSADLARERVGMFLEVEYPDREVSA